MFYKGYDASYLVIDFSKKSPVISVQISKGRTVKHVEIPMSHTIIRSIEKELQTAINEIINEGKGK